MTLIRPFKGLRPASEYASKVIAPPYDVLNRAEAKTLAHGNELSFLHISKAEIDCEDNVSAYDASVYQTAADNVAKMRQDNILIQDEKPAYYVYQMQQGDLVQTGLVAVVATKAYAEGRVRKHELTREVKETDRVNVIKAVHGQLSPLLLTYHHDASVEECFQQVIEQAPLYHQIQLEDVQHSLWKVDQPELIEQLTTAFDAMETIYVADGHHRSAAATRVANEYPEQENCQYFLSVLIPDNEVNILSYNRVIRDLNGMSEEGLLEKLKQEFDVSEHKHAIMPEQVGHFGMYLNGRWYQLVLKSPLRTSDPIKNLDVSILHEKIIEPFFGITDLRTDERIDYVGGSRGAEGLEQRVDSGEMAIAFSAPATRIDQLLDVADANQIMPPKSTWFAPKLADGLISYLF